MKLVVGLLSGSLGILAEAAHSGLDLVAALVTLVAVSVSDRPADEAHPYGHGKVENFSALIETLLLFVTCAWIIYEAVQRIFFRDVHVEPSLWAFLVVVVSIGDRRQPVPHALPGRQEAPQPGPRGRRPPLLDRRLDARPSSSAAWPSSWSGRSSFPAGPPSSTGPTPWPPWASPSSSSSSATGSASGRSTSSSTGPRRA
ncbi:MAG: cation diffusion facilitator family transporter [Candidatus Moduliflexus flocculans]|nr:cation diffusion facilitator family transporter [Candidatus Moduliflexus flocculans]